MLSAQQIFDKVAIHLYTQGRPAKHLGLCRYRDDAGRSCAVGCLMPDESYDPAFDDDNDGGTALTAVVDNPKFIQALADGGVDVREHFELLLRLQNTHDCMQSKNGLNWVRERLESTAEDFGLSKDVLAKGDWS